MILNYGSTPECPHYWESLGNEVHMCKDCSKVVTAKDPYNMTSRPLCEVHENHRFQDGQCISCGRDPQQVMEDLYGQKRAERVLPEGVAKVDFVVWLQDKLAEQEEQWANEKAMGTTDRWLSGYITALTDVLKEIA